MQGYRAPRILFNNHLETIYPALFRKVTEVVYQRERIPTPDQDFLDLDWLSRSHLENTLSSRIPHYAGFRDDKVEMTPPNNKLIIISHGLEGNSHRAYVKGMARIFYQHGYDVLAWNYRGCSEEMNRQLRFYHSGATDDLDVVVQHAASKGYTEINLIGFSLGGNLTLKYAGEKGSAIAEQVNRIVTFSVPLHLHTSSIKIATSANGIYAKRFLKTLKHKVALKANLIPGIDTQKLDRIKNLFEFDDAYTASLHGFDSALDYYERCSSLYFLNKIQRPTLLVNAWNDPFLSAKCYPDDFKNHSYLSIEYPQRGGHVGFAQFNKNGVYWSELRALQFIHSGT
jgi:uncharacterized protein